MYFEVRDTMSNKKFMLDHACVHTHILDAHMQEYISNKLSKTVEMLQQQKDELMRKLEAEQHVSCICMPFIHPHGSLVCFSDFAR